MDTTNFDRTWQWYKEGFGTVCGSFWLGLDNIHQLTKWKIAPHELRVDLWDWEGNTAHAKYQSFWIGGSDSHYALFVNGYSGTAGDSMTYSNGMRFTTTDRDNDLLTSANCAVLEFGAFWHRICRHANLNGPYSIQATVPTNQGIIWYHWKRSWTYSMKMVDMKIRPNQGTC